MAKSLPGIFSVQRGFIISDALMHNLFEDGTTSRISVIRHGILGTQNVAGKDRDGIKNPQRTESAKTDPDAIGMEVRFALSTIPLTESIFACNDNEFRNEVKGFIDQFKRSPELTEICNRYARNILNGRWLWRNRILGQKISIKVESEDATIEMDATARPHDAFGDYSDEERKLGDLLADSLAGNPHHLNISARIDFGMRGSIEVFPSQNFIGKKPDGFARSLYKVDRIDRKELLRVINNDDPMSYFGDIIDMGHAAIRDQKIGNAIRTIDTWYEEGKESAPIPVEPKGANIETNVWKRTNNHLFGMIIQLGGMRPSIDSQKLNRQAMFVLSNLVRGFLAGEKEEEKSGSGKKAKDAEAGQSDLLEEVTQ